MRGSCSLLDKIVLCRIVVSPVDQAGLAHAAVAKQDHLGQLWGECRLPPRRVLQRRRREPGLLVRRAVPRVGRREMRYFSRLPWAFLAHGEMILAFTFVLIPARWLMVSKCRYSFLSDAIGGFTSYIVLCELSPPPSAPAVLTRVWLGFVRMWTELQSPPTPHSRKCYAQEPNPERSWRINRIAISHLFGLQVQMRAPRPRASNNVQYFSLKCHKYSQIIYSCVRTFMFPEFPEFRQTRDGVIAA